MLREPQETHDRGWLGWIFILLVVVVLPLEVSFGFLGQILEENSEFQKGNLQVQLEKQARSIVEGFNPHFVLQPLFSNKLLGRDSRTRMRFIRGLAHRYPGAFKIVMWNPAGKILPSPRPLTFPAHIPFPYLIEQYLRHGRGAEIAYNNLVWKQGGDPALQSFQMFLGSSLSLRDFFRKNETLIEFQQQGEPALLFWGGPGKDDHPDPQDKRFNVTGYFIQINRSKLPKEFLTL